MEELEAARLNLEDSANFLDVELQALQSIYINEINVERNDEDKPVLVSIDLRPATADKHDEQYVKMTLKFSLKEEYPQIIPDINIQNPRGLSDEKINLILQDLEALALEKTGNSMLFEIIEAAKEHLTTGNHPCGTCAICLHGFSECDVFTKTDCYHYFHSYCLARYAQNLDTVSEVEGGVKETSSKELLCPMCRVAIVFHGKESDFPPPSGADEEYTICEEILMNQKKMAEIYEKQLEQGGIIDVEAERNKYLIEIADIPSGTNPPSETDEPTSVKTEESVTKDVSSENPKAHEISKRSEHEEYKNNRNWGDRKDNRHTRYQKKVPHKDYEELKVDTDSRDAEAEKYEGMHQDYGKMTEPTRRRDGNRFRSGDGGGYGRSNSFKNHNNRRGGRRYFRYRSHTDRPRNNSYREDNSNSMADNIPDEQPPHDPTAECQYPNDEEDRKYLRESSHLQRRHFPRKGGYRQGANRQDGYNSRGDEGYFRNNRQSRKYPDKRSLREEEPELDNLKSTSPDDVKYAENVYADMSCSEKNDYSSTNNVSDSEDVKKPSRPYEREDHHQGNRDRRPYNNRKYSNNEGSYYARNDRQRNGYGNRQRNQRDDYIERRGYRDSGRERNYDYSYKNAASGYDGGYRNQRYNNERPYNRSQRGSYRGGSSKPSVTNGRYEDIRSSIKGEAFPETQKRESYARQSSKSQDDVPTETQRRDNYARRPAKAHDGARSNGLNELMESSCSITEKTDDGPNVSERPHKESDIVPYSELNAKKVVAPPPGFVKIPSPIPSKRVVYGLKAANPPPGFPRS